MLGASITSAHPLFSATQPVFGADAIIFRRMPTQVLYSDDLRYPIGQFAAPATINNALRNTWMDEIAALPGQLAAAIHNLNDTQLDTPYRPGGWTVRQLVHHVADSHLNSVVRFRLALTEDRPLIKAYEEKLWAELPDARTLSPEISLNLLTALHARWIALLRSMSDADFKRTLRHPESGELSLERMLALYAWHGRHHTAHILNLRLRNAS
jgi:uncharacterized damage-inducible protein DinB